MVKDNLSDIQKEELKMLKVIVEFFKKEKLDYFLCGGTLLGAIRHNGFIPWDDDIDIAMPRKEYEKLIEIGKKNKYAIKDNFEISSFEINGLPKPFCKILNKDIEIVDNAKIDKYLWIDIFPIDGLPNDLNKIKKIYKKEHFYKLLLRLKISKSKYDSSIKGISKKIVRVLLRIIKKDFFINKMIKVAKKVDYESSELVGCVVWGYGIQERIDKKLLEIKQVKFENMDVNGIQGYDKYLTSLYGDYMQLPPESERINHNISIKRTNK